MIVFILVGLIVIVPGWLLGASEEWCRKHIEIITAEFPTLIMQISGIWSIEFIDNTTHTTKSNTTPNNIKTNSNYIIVSNHLSVIDTIFTAQLPFKKIFTWKKK